MEIVVFGLIAAGKCSKRLLDSYWIMLKGAGMPLKIPKGHWIVSGQFLKV
jgi:hypothetical protein